MTRIIISIVLLATSLIGKSQTSTVFFKDSISTAYKLMGLSVTENKNSEKTELTIRNGQKKSFDLSDVHSLRFYASTQDSLSLIITCFSNNEQSTSIKYQIKGGHSGYNNENFKIPTNTINKTKFNYKEITSIEIKATGQNKFLLDEFSFHYSDDNILITGPQSLNPLLKDKATDFRNEKSKENNSDFFKRKKELERR